MTQQTEAERIADRLEQYAPADNPTAIDWQAAAELRRLSAVEQAYEALKAQEPVAWWREDGSIHLKKSGPFDVPLFTDRPLVPRDTVYWLVEDHDLKHLSVYTKEPVVGKGQTLTPLYTAPQPAVREWQSIDTAPQDGSELLLRSAKGRIANGVWVAVNGARGYWAWPYVSVEPVEWMLLPLNARPQPAKWVGLTNEEIYPLYSEPSSDAEMVEFARAIEQLLRSKNEQA